MVGSGFLFKGEIAAAFGFLIGDSTEGEGTRTTSKQVRIPLHASLLRRLERSKTILTAFYKRNSNVLLDLPNFKFTLKMMIQCFGIIIKNMVWRHRLINITENYLFPVKKMHLAV